MLSLMRVAGRCFRMLDFSLKFMSRMGGINLALFLTTKFPLFASYLFRLDFRLTF
jgi:hypothetical protein